MLFKSRFDDESKSLESNLDTLDQAISGIRDNEGLKDLFELILRIGNFMNYGTNKGKALGFKMSLLLKLKDIKSYSSTSKISLMEYIIICMRKCETSDTNLNSLDFIEELKVCDLASKIELSILDNKMSSLESGLFKVKKQVLKYKNDADPSMTGAAFLAIYEPFSEEAESKCQLLAKRVIETKKQVGELITTFGEDKGSCKPSEFFQLFHSF